MHSTALVVIVLACSGCAGWLSTSTETAIDSRRHAAIGQRVELGIALGDDSKRVYAATEVTAGYAMREHASFVTVEDELGYEGGGPLRVAAGLRAGATFLTLDDEQAPAITVGPTGKLAFRLVHPDGGNDLYVGPEVGAAVVTDPAGAWFRASAAIALRWVFTDYTEDRPARFLR